MEKTNHKAKAMTIQMEKVITILVIIGIIVSAVSMYNTTGVVSKLSATEDSLADVTSKLDEMNTRLGIIEEAIGAIPEPTPPSPTTIKDSFIIAYPSDAVTLSFSDITSGDYMGNDAAYTAIYDMFVYYKVVYDSETDSMVTTVTKDGTHEFVPGVIESWEHSSDYKVWTLQVRKGMTFHSGNPLDGRAVYRSLVEYYLDTWCLPYWFLAGYAMDYSKENIDHVKESIELVDDYTVRFTLDVPNPNFMAWVAGTCSSPIDVDLLLEHGEIEMNMPHEWMSRNGAGSGPFELVSWEPEKEMVFRRFEDWWGPKPEFKWLIFKVIPDLDIQMMMLEKGEIDAIYMCPPKEAKYLEDRPNIKVASHLSLGGVTINFNANKTLDGKPNPLSEVKVRQMLQYTFPCQEFIDTVLYGRADLRKSVLPKGALGYTEEFWDPEWAIGNLTKAKAMLVDTEYPDGFEFDAILSEARLAIAEDVAVIWKEELRKIGVTLNIKVVPHSQYYELNARRRAAQCTISASYGASYVQEWRYQMFWGWHPKAGTNYMNRNVTDWLRLFEEASITEDPDRQLEIAREMQELLIETAYSIPIAQLWLDRPMNENVKNYFFHWWMHFFHNHPGVSTYVEIPTG